MFQVWKFHLDLFHKVCDNIIDITKMQTRKSKSAVRWRRKVMGLCAGMQQIARLPKVILLRQFLFNC